jgi:hypothetical protein
VNLVHKNPILVFLVTLFSTLAAPVLVPSLRFSFFIPFIIILFYQKPFYICLWASFACGAILDLLSSHHPYGLFALNFCFSTACLYPQRKNFFTDSITTLPILTFFYSLASTLIQIVLLYTFDQHPLFSWTWILTDLILLPAFDALFAFGLFILPFLFFGKPPLKGKDYFMEHE